MRGVVILFFVLFFICMPQECISSNLVFFSGLEEKTWKGIHRSCAKELPKAWPRHSSAAALPRNSTRSRGKSGGWDNLLWEIVWPKNNILLGVFFAEPPPQLGGSTFGFPLKGHKRGTLKKDTAFSTCGEY